MKTAPIQVAGDLFMKDEDDNTFCAPYLEDDVVINTLNVDMRLLELVNIKFNRLK